VDDHGPKHHKKSTSDDDHHAPHIKSQDEDLSLREPLLARSIPNDAIDFLRDEPEKIYRGQNTSRTSWNEVQRDMFFELGEEYASSCEIEDIIDITCREDVRMDYRV
jgi:hypothetical protein